MMKYNARFTKEFRRQSKLMKKRGKDITKLDNAIRILASGESLPERYRDHYLTGNFINCKECHIEPDWLLIYKIIDDELILLAMATGTHSDLF